MKKIATYKGINVYLNKNKMFECIINNETYIYDSFYEIKEKIQLYKATRQKVNIPFVFVADFDKLKIKEGVILEVIKLGRQDYRLVFECESVLYRGTIHSANGIYIDSVEILENKNNSTDLIKHIVEMFVNIGEVKNKLITYMKAVNYFEKEYVKANKELKNLLK